jgi:hydrogenase nickel incorporation protein HypA/HybF
VHESSLIADLLEKIEAVAHEHSADKVTAIEISIGALSGIGPDHLREHFNAAAAGTVAEGAELRLNMDEDPLSTGLLLQSVELER